MFHPSSVPAPFRTARLSSRSFSLRVLFLLFISLPYNVCALQVTLAWDANPDPAVAGYKLYYGYGSRSYASSVDVGEQTMYTLSGLAEGRVSYFAATAYDVDGNESDFSAEVVYNPSDTSWTDYRLALTMQSNDNDSIGVIVRYQDKDNYYRFSWDRERAYRRLVKREKGVFTLLAEDSVPYVQRQTYKVEIVAQGTTLEVWIDGIRTFDVQDASVSGGTIALYSWYNQGSYFDNVLVKDLATDNFLLSDDFNDGQFDGWTIVDEGTSAASSIWSAVTGTLVQSSNIYSKPTSRDSLDKLGTYMLYAKRGTQEIPQSQMSVVAVDSEELEGVYVAADNVLDGQTDTFWHTEWFLSSPPHPHEIILALGGLYTVSGFRYLPRQSVSVNGTVADYAFYVSEDGVSWGSAVATGTFPPDTTRKEVVFPGRAGRFVRFVALSEINGNPWTSAAEITVLRTQ